ncbi:MAG: hypothetical protein AAF378_05800 [Cyanobacteria bacterium P01_A01_bin.84]
MNNNSWFIQQLIRIGSISFLPSLTKGTVILIFAVVMLGIGTKHNNFYHLRPALAQSRADFGAWRQLYQQLPNFPKENNYTSKNTGKITKNHTLARRMLEYHIYYKGRAPNYRLDWKLTLADYLGANEVMYNNSYPGSNTLKKNPLEGDRAVISKLNRNQRNALVQAFVNIFTTNTPKSSSPPSEK